MPARTAAVTLSVPAIHAAIRPCAWVMAEEKAAWTCAWYCAASRAICCRCACCDGGDVFGSDPIAALIT